MKLARRSGGHRESGEGRDGGGDADEARFHNELSPSMGALPALCDQDFGIRAYPLEGPSPISQQLVTVRVDTGRIAGI